MLKEENIVEALSKNLKNEKVKAYVYASDLKANNIWIWIILFIIITVVVFVIPSQVSIIICALVGGLVGGISGYNQPTYLGVTNKNNLLICKMSFNNKTPRFVLRLPISSLTELKIIENSKNGKNVLHFKYNKKEFEYIYFRNIRNKYLNQQSKNIDIFNKQLNK